MKEMNEGKKSTEQLEIILAKQKELYTKKREKIQTREKEITETVVKQWEKLFEEFIIPNLANFNNDEISIEFIDITTKKHTPEDGKISFITTFGHENVLSLEIQGSELMTYINSHAEVRIQEDFERTKYAPYFHFSTDDVLVSASTTCTISPIYK